MSIGFIKELEELEELADDTGVETLTVDADEKKHSPVFNQDAPGFS